MFLTRLQAGAQSYRKVRDAIKHHFREVDVKKIRDELVADELIVLSHYETKHFGTETRTVPFYELCEPKLTVDDNKVKSGFDYSGPSSIFTKMLEMKSNKRLQSLAQINVYGKA